jgi:protein gp37
VETNAYLDRVDVLREVPAVVRFISAEPLLGPLSDLNLKGIHWLIVGGESGPNFRHMEHAWARELRDMAKSAGVAFFFKQSSGRFPGRGTTLDGREWKEWPTSNG